jgi:hypothetical protein
MLAMAIGGVVFGGATKKQTGILHGVGLLLLFIAGFGMIAKLQVSYVSGWIIAKMVIWLVFGGSIALLKKNPAHAQTMMWILIVLGAASGYLAVYKPF